MKVRVVVDIYSVNAWTLPWYHHRTPSKGEGRGAYFLSGTSSLIHGGPETRKNRPEKIVRKLIKGEMQVC